VTEIPDLALPTYAVLARFREQAPSREAAVRGVVERLTAAEEPFHEVDVERDEGADGFLVVARFVLVSVDGTTAVAGLHETLVEAGLAPDEVWVDRQVS
jgi:hypothetical protein